MIPVPDPEFFARIDRAITRLESLVEDLSFEQYETNRRVQIASVLEFGVIVGALQGLDHGDNRARFTGVEWDRIQEMSRAFLRSDGPLKPIITWGFIHDVIPALRPIVQKALAG